MWAAYLIGVLVFILVAVGVGTYIAYRKRLFCWKQKGYSRF